MTSEARQLGLFRKTTPVSLLGAALLLQILLAKNAKPEVSGSQDSQVPATQSGTSAGCKGAGAAVPALPKDGRPQPQTIGRLLLGMTLTAELTRSIDAGKNKVGDEVALKTKYDVVSNGSIVIPKGSKLIGHVTEVQSHGKDHPISELRIVFDRVVLKNGPEMPLLLVIQAIGRATIAHDNDSVGASTPVAPGGLLGGIGSPTAGGSPSSLGRARPSILSSTSQGVVGFPGLTLSNDAGASASTPGSLISSNAGNVHLDNGTEMVLRVNP